MEFNNQELESFRRQWLEEVSARTRRPSQPSQPSPKSAGASGEPSRKPRPQHQAADREEEPDFQQSGNPLEPINYEALTEKTQYLTLGPTDDDASVPKTQQAPSSALELFEEAVNKEAQGSLGDSLALYRKAYKLDARVDQAYRKKHFPPANVRLSGPNPSNASVTVPNTAHHSSEAQPVLSTADLIASFAHLPIPVADPLIAGTPPPPCPISTVPSEILSEILKQVALLDPALFARLALVCKRFAYLVEHEQPIWRRLCQGPEFGFGSMHYSFSCDIEGRREYTFRSRYTPFPLGSTALQIPKPLSTWAQVFQTFPRIRFTGIYISTVNYTRPGAHSSFHNVSWNAPIHIVTYYRYLRFYPDGSLISLLTTTDPVDVVPHISKENIEALQTPPSAHRQHQNQVLNPNPAAPVAAVANPIPTVASSALKSALKGRWHLSHPSPVKPTEDSKSTSTTEIAAPRLTPQPTRHGTNTSSDPKHDPRDLFIETEGVDPKYTYTMHLALRSAATPSRSATHGSASTLANTSKNTKLVWKGFWSYNRLTDDWGEFGLRNDRAFVFRRVRGWGLS
ncbi:F-box domain-containing protein [Coccidioides immitis RS]|uniref:F-box domain-containing protein n=3 Tax=Coccidioides immitis TaxID=5501 RepID=J3KIB2_COCIM|nr:F-box domain-containing protein [Coccidioides immitis RS]EAS35691.3 F-box domain-containing protein [Coccidioides immitis RS]KMP00968.1 F-box protein pof7 [Coccidioides immitis RMSCC 2394]KMU72796.1 F-box domain containing protein pof7 [Coccidioides immitis RMSCC 3703]TPX26087.1 hypothetical protein DIZ76_011546 [Coccidioides immitis]